MSVHNWFTFRSRWPNFGPLVAAKWLKMVVSEHYLKKYSPNSIQTRCVHLLGECSQLICFWAMLAKFWACSGHKMTENGGFRPSSEKVFPQSDSNLVCTLTVWVFRIDLLLGWRWPNHGPLMLQNDWKLLFPTIFWKCNHAIQFKLGAYTYWLSLQNWFAFGPRWPTFWSSSGHKIT